MGREGLAQPTRRASGEPRKFAAIISQSIGACSAIEDLSGKVGALTALFQRQEQAAVSVQARARGMLGRREAALMVEEQEAARHVQETWLAQKIH